MKLTAQNVHNVFTKCLFKDLEHTDNHILADGVKMKIGFHPERLKQNKENILSMLSGLPEQFQKETGGGWSFMNACQDKDGNQWADMHQTVDELVCLGRAVGAVEYPMPREMWEMLPGGMPYFAVSSRIVAVHGSDTTDDASSNPS